MCGGREQSLSVTETETNPRVMNHLNTEADNSFNSILEFAADDNVEGLKNFIDYDASSLNGKGKWYIRKKGSKQVISECRTPLMVAATYGSLDVLNLILSYDEVDVNLSCGLDKSTALHCAASCGAINAVDVVLRLLSAGADPNWLDSNGDRPIDVIFAHPNMKNIGVRLEDLLKINNYNGSVDVPCLPLSIDASMSSVRSYADGRLSSTTEKKEYPSDPSLPDIRNSIYMTDEFRMFSFKVRPCSRAYSHDWTDCPFVHPGENARRRDPRKYHYSCMPCPDFKKGPCRHGDMCEYAHGVFESWLHPAQYRTRLCKDGTNCNRRVCFFAHTIEELRPLHVSIGSAGNSMHFNSSPANVMDMATAMNYFPASPSSVSNLSHSPFSQCLSPSMNGISPSIAWPQSNVPSLHLPGSNLQSSRLSCFLGPQNIPCRDLNMIPDFDSVQQVSNDFTCFSQPHANSASVFCSEQLPLNFNDPFASQSSSSPKFPDPVKASIFSPTHQSVLLNQCRQQYRLLTPINQSILSPRSVEHPLLQASFGVSSQRRMSPRVVEPISPAASRFSAYALQEKHLQQFRSLSSRDRPSAMISSPDKCSVNSWPSWGSPEEKVDWSVNEDDLARSRRSLLKLDRNEEEPDLTLDPSLVKEPLPEMLKDILAVPVSSAASSGEDSCMTDPQFESTDHSVLSDWLERMQLDQIIV